jgi:hypothetical protein
MGILLGLFVYNNGGMLSDSCLSIASCRLWLAGRLAI